MSEEDGRRRSWLRRLTDGLGRSRNTISGGISAIFSKRTLDDAALDELADLLIAADVGTVTAMGLIEGLRRTRFDRDIGADEVRRYLAAEIAKKLMPVAIPFTPDPSRRPHVVLVVGVNGSGKTTTIGKFAHDLKQRGFSVILAAGDTFRAAAIEQLIVWGARAGCPVVSGKAGADAAGLAFDALTKAREERADVLLIDTAGRLQNKSDLMAELEKIIRVLKKIDETAPHSIFLVLDATTGQNALSQVDVFRKSCAVNGLIMTKLDGTARGGILVALAEKQQIPIHSVGVGEGIDDLQAFDAEWFARALVGLEKEK